MKISVEPKNHPGATPVHPRHHLERAPTPAQCHHPAPPFSRASPEQASAGSERSALGTPGSWEILNDLL